MILLFGWSAVHAPQVVRQSRLGRHESRGALPQRMDVAKHHVAPLGKIQVVAVHESPFDRRLRMAGVVVDTAGASGESHRVRIPYLSRDTADRLAAGSLAVHAARSTFRW